MDERDLPVFVAELVFPGQEPFLRECGNSIHVTHYRGSDVMWHKERLLNLTVARLPSRYTKVAWIDADVIFPDERWYERTSALLESQRLVQLFDTVHRLDDAGNEIGTAEGLAAYISRGKPEPFNFGGMGSRPGLAWAARRSILEAHGLFDQMILGGSDTYMSLAAYDSKDEAVSWHLRRLPPRLKATWSQWAAAFYADVAGDVGFVQTPVLQLGHGTREDRKYSERLAILSENDFDPGADIAADACGVWRWSSAKPALHAQISQYFADRLEDG
jgi:hypothetical protein